MSRRVFLTGATGYIGGALARRLAVEGWQVRALVRGTSDRETVEALRHAGVETFVGDVVDRVSMREGMAGSDWVVHAAADLDMGGPVERMRSVNGAGTENVASLAAKLGTGRFLLLSSMAAFGGSPADGTAVTEDDALRLPPPSLYSATKRAGEEAARAWAAKGLRLHVVWPSLVYGPPGKRRGTNALLRQFAKGRMPALVGADRRTSWIFLDDLVDGLVRVMEHPPEVENPMRPGTTVPRDYLMTGEVATVGEVARRVCELAGTRPPRLALPVGVAKLALAVAGPFYRLRGFRPPLPPDTLESLRRHWAFDDSRARHELDWHPRPLSEGLPPTVEVLLA
ncbi:MAG TPA: NAD-dependent epimerase/dehydratase family protein [Thermoanaerobaculia bacterium]|nr:NAD-dependent epimerase/dehydratase family protein [Thermoanaerobaculia bacterium]